MSEVYAVHGAFVFLNAGFIKAAMDDLRDAPFLFGEELHIAEAALKYKWKILFAPLLKVYHAEHQSFGIIKSRKHLNALKKSVDYRISRTK